jgi:DUF1680 family protein
MKKSFFLIFCVIGILSCMHAQEKLYANEFPLRDVILRDRSFQTARDLNIKTLLKYQVDRLMAGYRKEAGLAPKDSSYTNWEGLDGHIAGHYLSALSMNVAATGNAECKKRMLYIIAELMICQNANTKNHPGWGKGYAGAVPHSDKIWPALKNGDFTAYQKAWVPWYNLHKMYAGLRDTWLFTGNQEAKTIFLHFCDWAIFITSGLSDDQMQQMLDTEQGGMNEILADAFQMTDNPKYLVAAKRFSHRMLLEPMSVGTDNLDNKHANTQIPKAIGFERIGELSEDKTYKSAGNFFWLTVTRNRSLAFGGNSRREFFPASDACSDFVNDVEGPESCNSYNMLKLTQDLFRVNPSASYMDNFERTLYNHILSTQNPETGGYVYFTPVRPRSYRVYSAPNESMWCCVGSGMENHSKYNELIYTHRHDSLFLNLFVASDLFWREKSLRLKQETNFPYEEHTKITLTAGGARFSLMIRYPAWVADGALVIEVNGKPFSYKGNPSSYIPVTREWKKGDVVEIFMPMHNSIEQLPHLPQYVAILHGPIVLAAKTGTEDIKGLIADDSRWGHIPSGKKLPLDQAPVIIGKQSEIKNALVPIQNNPLHFTLQELKMINPIDVELQPFFQIHGARYMIYWMNLTGDQYQKYLDSLSGIEKQKLLLQQRTIDWIAPGEQQPEADHGLQTDHSHSGDLNGRMYREASDSGYFSYKLSTGGQSNLKLMVTYWGAEWGNRKFDIYIDDKKLLTEDNTGRWNRSAFFDVMYEIPDSILGDKKNFRIKFQSIPGNTAGGVYGVRVVTIDQSENGRMHGTFSGKITCITCTPYAEVKITKGEFEMPYSNR